MKTLQLKERHFLMPYARGIMVMLLAGCFLSTKAQSLNSHQKIEYYNSVFASENGKIKSIDGSIPEGLLFILMNQK
ncbi:hypothetical protein DBR43_11545 [Pedobacter sp. KBW06]|uniref:hypothetical protein n=1 Tax=Pedobacter sp. KBW06 TaxID=2153359 RepID=UPI000F5A94B3|nr:hypothetical protein [Pedobacter sp. KBW06]RQO71861.1 hypothetical protein DBR43_11545 [Pedobacter sp. KBW06]